MTFTERMTTLFDPAGYTYSPFGLPMALVALLSLVVGVWVYAAERGSRISLSFFAATVAVSVYLLSFSLMVQSATEEVALVWARVAYVGVPFIVPAIYHFSIVLLGLSERRRWLIRAAWLFGVLYAAVAVGTDWLIEGVQRQPWGYYTELTPWHTPVAAALVVLIALVVRDYWREHRDADPVQRSRIRWLAIPLVVGAVGFIDFAPSLGLDVEPWGFVFFSAFFLAAARVVARYSFPDLTPALAADEILSTMAEPLLVVNELGQVAIANPAAVELLGGSPEEVQGSSLASLLGIDTATALLNGSGLRDEELEIHGGSGEPIAVSVSTKALMKRGRSVGTVIVARDIRDRRRAARALERREEHFRALTEHARDTISILDAEGRITYQSPSHQEVLGREPGMGVGVSVFTQVHPEDRADLEARFAELVANPGEAARTEVRIAHGDGGYRVLDIRAQNLLDHPAVRGVVVNGRDVTRERQLTEQLQQSHKLEAIGRLAGGIAHDFNNILTTIQGTVALLKDELEGSAFTAELDVIHEGAERAGRLTSHLLAFGRRQVTRPVALDLGRAVEELRPELQRAAGVSVALVIRAPEASSPVRVDPGQIREALLDLGRNARDAMDGAGRLEIDIENVTLDGDAVSELPLEGGPYVRITVADDGRGMDEATRRRVFEPFFTTKDPAFSAGLGLATVYGSVRQAGGHIDVESRPGAGARFIIHLPRIDLLITDLVMPGLTGREVAERLTAEEPGMAAILISGYTADEAVRDGINRGDYVFIPKPFSPSTLTDRVAEVLEGRPVRSATP